MRRFRTWVAALLIFGSGMAVGGVGGLMWMGHFVRSTLHGGSPRMEQHVMRRLDRKLDLRADQHEAVAKAVRQAMEDSRALHDEVRPKFQAILDTAVTNLQDHLTPEQREKLDALHATWKRRR